MNIGIVTTWFPAGGGYVAKAYRQALENHEIYIFARQGKRMKGDSIWDDTNVYWAKNNYNGIDVKEFKKWIIKNKIDLIFFNEQRYWKPVLIAKEMGVCIGAYIDYYKEDTIKAFSIYDFLICNTRRHYSVFDWHPNCYYVPWGTDIDVFKPHERAKDGKIKFILSLGWEGEYIGDRKGLMLAINAFTKVIGECELLVYSQVQLSDCLLAWKSLIESDERIKYITGTFDPFPYYEGDIYVYPSRLDGIGLSLPEAISCGLPAIATDNPPMNEFVINSINGKLIEVERYIARSDGYYWPQSICNIISLTQAMQDYIDNPTTIRVQSINARNFAENKLNWTKNSEKLVEIFENSLVTSRIILITPEIKIYLSILDRQYYPSLVFRFLTLLDDITNLLGFNTKKLRKIIKKSIK